ncbi:hypothetical protein [Embleya sp. NPDC059237]|uniref:hypothetical protein n=1 Tax=Embleya sp. NPDC059237 TaxID=3346784 RepID=UPI0036A28598
MTGLGSVDLYSEPDQGGDTVSVSATGVGGGRASLSEPFTARSARNNTRFNAELFTDDGATHQMPPKAAVNFDDPQQFSGAFFTS